MKETINDEGVQHKTKRDRSLCDVGVIEHSGLLGHTDVSRGSVVLDVSKERNASVFRVKIPRRIILPRSFEMWGTTHPTTQF